MILVTGATGTIGGALAHLLADLGRPVRALVRDPARAAAGLPAAVERAVGDLDRPETLPTALNGVDRLFLMESRYGTEQTEAMVAAARAAGVRHIVNLSSIGVTTDPMPSVGRWHHACEEVIRASGITATFLRPGEFMTNTLRWLPSIRAAGEVRDPIGPGRTAPIDPADIAAVAAVAFDAGGLDEDPVLTGDELLTVGERVRILAAVLGRPIRHVEITPQQAADAALAAGQPPAFVEATRESFESTRAGLAAVRTDAVRRITGRSPATFEDWCRRNAAAFA